MEEFLEAVAQSLRNYGLDAVASYQGVQLSGIRFEARTHWRRKSFQFCGRTYRIGNVGQAVIDLLRQLPELVAMRDEEIERRREGLRLEPLNKSLQDYGLRLFSVNGRYKLIYEAELSRLEEVARQIMHAEDITFEPINIALGSLSATFTSEGGFSLN